MLLAALPVGVAAAQSSAAPAWIMPPPPASTRSASPAAGPSQTGPLLLTPNFSFVAPSAAADLPLSIYASPLIIFAVKGLIAHLAAHHAAQQASGEPLQGDRRSRSVP
jgi:hypothetical protein